MEKSGKRLTHNIPRFGNKSLVSASQEENIKRRNITFSFSFFRQIPNFGLEECSKEWYIGLLQRLETLGNMTQQEILEENRGSKALRCHPINWSARNIPIQRKDLYWLPREILENEDDFPMMQIGISKSTGRIVGFFDGNSSTFHIVLLDPKHNIQPSKKTNYQIQHTREGLSQYDELLKRLERVKEVVKNCKCEKCKLYEHIDSMDNLHNNIVYVELDNEFYNEYSEIVEEHSLKEILEAGILGMIK